MEFCEKYTKKNMEFCDFIAKTLGNFVKNKYFCKQNRTKKY